MPRVNRCWPTCGHSATAVRSGEWKGLHRQGHHRRREHRHRRFGSWPGHGDRSTDALPHRRGSACILSRTSMAHISPRHSSMLDPETTLFIIASKTFTTQETLANAIIAQGSGSCRRGGSAAAVASHFVALSTNTREVVRFGIDPRQHVRVLGLGGRPVFSLVGHRAFHRARIGMDSFEELLAGAFAMDEHFRTQPLEKNMPVTPRPARDLVQQFLRCHESRHPAVRPVPPPLSRISAAGGHGEQREACHPRR